MATAVKARDGARDPVTFATAPTVDVDGVTRLTDDAARELGDQIATRFAPLLDRLAND